MRIRIQHLVVITMTLIGGNTASAADDACTVKGRIVESRSARRHAAPEGRDDRDDRAGAHKRPRYRPHTRAAVQLFSGAADLAGVPRRWARSPALHRILERESAGLVGRPNYTYGPRSRDSRRWAEVHEELRLGRITARSSATGLGQLLLDNVERFYPHGRAGIGDPVEEAAGMLAYIKSRYGTPERAWQLYGKRHEGY